MQPPDDIGGVLNSARLLEALKINGSQIVLAIQAGDDDYGQIVLALKSFKPVYDMINSLPGVHLAPAIHGHGRRYNLQVVHDDDGLAFMSGYKLRDDVFDVFNSH